MSTYLAVGLGTLCIGIVCHKIQKIREQNSIEKMQKFEAFISAMMRMRLDPHFYKDYKDFKGQEIYQYHLKIYDDSDSFSSYFYSFLRNESDKKRVSKNAFELIFKIYALIRGKKHLSPLRDAKLEEHWQIICRHAQSNALMLPARLEITN